MSKHWKEKTDFYKHKDFMSTTHIGGYELESSKEKGEWVYFVRECSFTFQFASLNQVREMMEYFSHKIHPSNKDHYNGLEHHWQRWYERLPKGLIASPKREKIQKALVKALAEFDVN